MKILVTILVAAGVGFASAYVIVSSRSEAEIKAQRAKFDTERAKLEAALAEAQNKPAKIETVVAPASSAAPTQASPKEILDKLIRLKPGTGTTKVSAIRQVVHHLETLREIGPAALPPIRQFLARHEDVDYAFEDAEGPEGRGASFWSWRRGQQLRTDFVLPPSLRLGLVDVVKSFGGGDAETTLGIMLNTTGRGVEVAYVARVLEEMSPGKYRDVAINAAKELLTNLPTIDQPNRLDENAKGYLYGVLKMYNDTSFTSTAQAQLIKPEGHIDTDALNYLTTTLKEQAMPDIVRAYKDNRITNRWEKVSLVNFALNYVGPSSDANQMFNELISNETLDSRLRAFSVLLLAGGEFGPLKRESPKDPQVIRDRMKLLDEMKSNVKDDRVKQSVDFTKKNLQNLLDGKPVENFPQQNLR